MKRMYLAGMALACLLPVANAAAQSPEPVQTADGLVLGSVEDGIMSWKGIPFARPPVGELRWRAPQPVAAWDGILAADKYANDCMQIPFPMDAAPLGTPPAEDCLYVNVWAPEGTGPGDDLPVMFWIYGGGFVNGGSSPAVYDGSELARQGVVLVSFNYRLGRFGFFAHPALSEADADNGLLGNYGFMDQIAALDWVQDNIGAFGGDPDKVTIFGESAGGGSVSMMMTSPRAHGKFDKAIVMSGGGRAMRATKTVADAEPEGMEFAAWAGISEDGAASVEELRAIPADTVAAGVGLMQQPVAPASGPMVDGTIVVEDASAIYAKGEAAPVPFMAGATSADIGWGPAPDGDIFELRFGPDADAARAAYAAVADDPEVLQTAIYADSIMVEPARYLVQQMTEAGQPAWHYRAGYVAGQMRDEWAGTPHATEIPFFFRTIDARYPEGLTGADHEAARQMSAYFVNFARTGNPNGDGLPEWPVYDDETRPVMDFTNDGPKGGEDPWRIRLDLTAAAAERAAE